MVKWDEFAALVALVAIPMMLSPLAIPVMKAIPEYLYTIIYPDTTRCERLQWSYVPDGFLSLCKDSHGCNGLHMQSSSTTYGELALEQVFQRAWVSASRRNITVTKPKQLDLHKKYIRMDTTAMQAYILMCQARHSVDLRVQDGLLMAHLVGSRYRTRIPCDLTKQELSLIIEGYPPCYRESVRLITQEARQESSAAMSQSSMISIPSPIQEQRDIYRGGWILAEGLSRTMPRHTSDGPRGTGHVMEEMKYTCRDHIRFDFVPRQQAVTRVRHVLEMIREAFPGQDAVVITALKIIQPFFQSGNPDWSMPGINIRFNDETPSQLAIGELVSKSGGISWLRSFVRKSELFGPEGTTFWNMSFLAQLPPTSWSRVLQIFDRFGPLTPDERTFLSPILRPVLRAAGRGICLVMTDDHIARSRVPEIPELDKDRYIYAYHCEIDENGHCNCEEN